MQNLRTLRQRIRSVQNTQKITQAMQMVAGAKLRRMQGELVGLRPFADRLQAMTDRFLAATPALEYPLLGNAVISSREAARDLAFSAQGGSASGRKDGISRPNGLEMTTAPPAGLVVVTSDTGLCGTYNERVLGLAERFLVENPSARVVAIGKKGSRFFARRGILRVKEILDWSGCYDPGRASELLDWLLQRYQQGEVAGWAVAATAFISALRWKPTVSVLLPLRVHFITSSLDRVEGRLSPSVPPSGGTAEGRLQRGSSSLLDSRPRSSRGQAFRGNDNEVLQEAVPGTGTLSPFGGEEKGEGGLGLPEKLIVEPDVERFAEKLLRRALEARFSRILLEAFTAEHSARMIAMKNATDNASEMIDHLTLIRNKARQAAITKELIEVVSGAEALR